MVISSANARRSGWRDDGYRFAPPILRTCHRNRRSELWLLRDVWLSHPSRLVSQLAAPSPIAKHFLKCYQVKLFVRPGLVDYRVTVASIPQFLNMVANFVVSAKQEHSVRSSKICNSRNRNDGLT